MPTVDSDNPIIGFRANVSADSESDTPATPSWGDRWKGFGAKDRLTRLGATAKKKLRNASKTVAMMVKEQMSPALKKRAIAARDAAKKKLDKMAEGDSRRAAMIREYREWSDIVDHGTRYQAEAKIDETYDKLGKKKDEIKSGIGSWFKRKKKQYADFRQNDSEGESKSFRDQFQDETKALRDGVSSIGGAMRSRWDKLRGHTSDEMSDEDRELAALVGDGSEEDTPRTWRQRAKDQLDRTKGFIKGSRAYKSATDRLAEARTTVTGSDTQPSIRDRAKA